MKTHNRSFPRLWPMRRRETAAADNRTGRRRSSRRRPPRLWLKLVFFFLLLAATAFILLQVIFNLAMDRHFEAYTAEREHCLNEQILYSISEYYLTTGSWSNFITGLRYIALSTNTRLALYSPQGELYFDSAAHVNRHGAVILPQGVYPADEAYDYLFNLEDEGKQVGRLYITHPAVLDGGAWEQQDFLFRRTLATSLFWTGLLAVSVALGLSIAFSRRLSQPLEQLAGAAQGIARGDYRQELPSYNSRELDELSRSFNSMASHLAELEALRRRSTADISHELRTPLATLRSYIEAIRDGVMTPDRETMDVLQEEIAHLGRVVADMDELATAESRNRDQVHREAIDLGRFLKDKVASFQPLFQEKQLSLELSLPAGAITVRQDPAALGKIMGNLLSNAYRYTGPGGTVRVALTGDPYCDQDAVAPLGEERLDGFGGGGQANSKGKTKGSGRSNRQSNRKGNRSGGSGGSGGAGGACGGDPGLSLAGMALITVADTGIGIKAEHLPYIFERFFRADPSRERSRGGTGIGLALVKELVRAAGGAVRVSSRPRQGTTFYLYLPRVAPDVRR